MKRTGGLLLLLLLSVAGVAISAYLVAAHAERVPLVCSTTFVINCASVTSSRYSVIPGTAIPISVLGVIWFLVNAAFTTAALAPGTAGRPEPSWLRLVQLGWASLGLLVVLYLIFVELVRLHQICEWCTAVHAIVIATFLVALHRLQSSSVAS